LGRLYLLVGSVLALLVQATAAHGYTLVRTIESPNASGDYFGIALAMAGDELLVGAPFFGHPASVAGRVERHDLASGAVLQSYVTPRPGVIDAFGYSVASTDDAILIGAPFDDLGSPMGRAFRFDAGSGVLLHTLVASAYDNYAFGYAVAAYAGDALVGLASQAGAEGTAVRFDAVTGAPITAYPDPLDDKGFGTSLLPLGTRVLVGQSEHGKVHAFDATSGALIQTHQSPDPLCGTFGAALAAVGEDFVVTSKGCAHRFDVPAGTLDQTYVNPEPTMTWFGTSVAGSTDRVLVGATDDEGQQGAAYLFHASTGALLEVLTDPEPGRPFFGRAVLLAGKTLVVGAPGDETVAGAVYVFAPCGDEVVDPGEQCDDGNTYGGDGCSATCQSEGSTTTSTTSSSSSTVTSTSATTSSTTTTFPSGPFAVVDPSDATMLLGGEIALSGRQSYDVSGGSLTFAWTLQARPAGSQADLADDSSSVARLTPDVAGSYEVDLVVSSAAGESDPARATIEVVAESDLSLSITEPDQGDTITSDRVRVTGTVAAPLNTGVAVNGVVAEVYGGTFIAEGVRLAAGTNVLTATATTPAGITLSSGIVVTAQAEPPILEFSASSASAISPAYVTFRLTFSSEEEIDDVAVDFDGDGQPELLDDVLPEDLACTYGTPGIYLPHVVVHDASGATHEATASVVVQSAAGAEAVFQAIWADVHAALLAEDVAAAQRFVHPRQRERFGAAWRALLPNFPAIWASYSPLSAHRLTPETADYFVTRTLDGELRVFFVAFVRDTDGVWRLYGM